MPPQPQPDLKREVEGLHAAMFLLQKDFGELKRTIAINEEEVLRRLAWYSALEQLAIEVGAYLKSGDDEGLREMWLAVGKLHKQVSPAIPRPALLEAVE